MQVHKKFRSILRVGGLSVSVLVALIVGSLFSAPPVVVQSKQLAGHSDSRYDQRDRRGDHHDAV